MLVCSEGGHGHWHRYIKICQHPHGHQDWQVLECLHPPGHSKGPIHMGLVMCICIWNGEATVHLFEPTCLWKLGVGLEFGNYIYIEKYMYIYVGEMWVSASTKAWSCMLSWTWSWTTLSASTQVWTWTQRRKYCDKLYPPFDELGLESPKLPLAIPRGSPLVGCWAEEPEFTPWSFQKGRHWVGHQAEEPKFTLWSSQGGCHWLGHWASGPKFTPWSSQEGCP